MTVTRFVPLRLVLPWPETLFPTTAGGGPSLLDRVGLTSFQASVSRGSTRMSLGLAVVEEVELGLPGLTGVVTAVLGQPGGVVSFTAYLDTGPTVAIGIADLPVSLRLNTGLLVPVERQGDQFVPRTNAGGETIPVDVMIGTVSAEVDLAGNITLAAPHPDISLEPVMIGETGLVIEGADIALYLNENAELPAAAPPGFRGLSVGNAVLYLPGDLSSLLPDGVTVTDAYLGTGGFSGTVSLEWAPDMTGGTNPQIDLGGFLLRLQAVDIELVQNALAAGRIAIAGELTVPFLDEVLQMALSLGHDGSFGAELAGAAGFEIGWSPSSGLSLASESLSMQTTDDGLSVTIPLSGRIGGIELHGIVIELGVGAEIRLSIGVVAGATLGPLILSVDNIGIALKLPQVGDSERTTLGPFDVGFDFSPPSGVGIGLDAGIVSGGGYLYCEPGGGGYAGVLDFDLLTIGISAFGIIDTKLPGGGWSLFFALYIDVPSIPLGFGFTLNGVGGVAGINRTLDVEGLQSAIRSGSLDGVLFPEDPILDAPLIIDAVQTIFPSAEGRYVFGPVIQIGWGTPTLIEAEIGIVIELPDPIKIALLGSVTSVLPTRDVDLVALHFEVAGIIDTGAGTLSIDSSLHGSHIVGFPLSGDMALRSAFGDAPALLMALGGSHPGFDRPDKFPEIDRLSLAINAGDLIDVRFDCYFALTSNSVQFGAAFEMSAEVEGFGINGGASFDALIDFSPFSLQTALGYHISVKAAGVDLLAVWLDVTLSGPNPWHVVGAATFTILGIDNTIKLDQKIGSKEREEPPESEDVLGQLRAALALPEAWSVGAGGGRDVVFAAEDPLSDELAVTPDGTLGVSQRVVPLGITIDKSEPWQIEGGYNRFDLESDVPGLASTGSLTDWFVVSSYNDLGPRERLSAPSFERLKSGIEFGGGAPTAGDARMGTLEYEQILRDPELDDATVKLPFNLSADPRAGELAEMATGQGTRGFAIAADEAPITVAAPEFAAVDELTGTVLGRRQPSWTATRLSSAGRKTGATIVPAWEVAA